MPGHSLTRLVIGASLSVLLGGALLSYFNGLSALAVATTQPSCASATILASTSSSVLQCVDALLCLVIPLFRNAVKDQFSVIVFSTLGSEAALVWAVAGIELSLDDACRKVDRFGLRLLWVIVFIIMSQCMGISVAALLLWVPGYIYDLKHINGAGGIAARGSLLPTRAFAYTVGAILTTFTMAVYQFSTDSKRVDQSIIAFNLVPIIIPVIVTMLTPRGELKSKGAVKAIIGHAGIIACIGVLFGFCLFAHMNNVVSLLNLVEAKGAVAFLADVKKLFQIPDVAALVISEGKGFGPTISLNIFLWDAIGLHVAILVLILTESGVLSGLRFLALSLILSPGASSALYFGLREWSFLRARLGADVISSKSASSSFANLAD